MIVGLVEALSCSHEPMIVKNRAYGIGLARRFFASQRGNAAVEFALLVPILLALFAGIVVFGIYLGASHNLKQIASEAARASIAGVSDQERGDLARRRVATALTDGAMFKPGTVSVAVGADPADATLYTVTLTFDAKTLGFSGLSGLVPLPPDFIRTTVSVRRGGL
ncbi:TadE/TadG family type IV pilus assembly protein [Methylobacterium sp. J-068]|uniref:TadE/TadG family type IV pilus assembly protein n=1 Tax=Methylobacterium sp. J-068 TaxID=2836649 RepID=UPI001FB948F7|nr:TadE/TadG family type IV pilus assembly protein [Methylobacterium sp. J-068]MCJ2033472.1 pilus assembly protein [Methylobacterium sp. J-068]